jgi:predicted metalloendopeptidase
LDKPVDKTEWYMSPQINAYYNPAYNEIVFPAAILQAPFYNYQADEAVNYGGIGLLSVMKFLMVLMTQVLVTMQMEI